jgi:hypothetical protein
MKVEIVTEGRLIDIIKDGFDAGVPPRAIHEASLAMNVRNCHRRD